MSKSNTPNRNVPDWLEGPPLQVDKVLYRQSIIAALKDTGADITNDLEPLAVFRNAAKAMGKKSKRWAKLQPQFHKTTYEPCRALYDSVVNALKDLDRLR